MHRSLGIAENDSGGRVFDFQNLDQRAILFHALAFAIEMLDFRHMDLRRGQGEHLGISQEFSRQLEHMGRIGSREQHRMDGRFGQIPLYFFHIRIEADGKHPVGFVKNQSGNMIKVERAPQEMVKHTAWRPHNNADSLTECLHLLAVADSAIDGGHGKAAPFEKRFGFLFHLNGKLAGRNENERLYGGHGRVQAGHERKQIGSRLTAARTGLDHEIPPFEQIGESAGLHGHKAVPPGLGAGCLKQLRQIGEGDFREGVFGFVDGDDFRRRLDGVGGVRLGFGLLGSRVGLGLLHLFGHVMSKSEKVKQELRAPGTSLLESIGKPNRHSTMVTRYGAEIFSNKKTAKALRRVVSYGLRQAEPTACWAASRKKKKPNLSNASEE